MKTWIQCILPALAAVAMVPALAGAGVSPSELQERREAGESFALVDVRSSGVFRDNHIPGALNIPARAVNTRRLPSSRTVVFYDDGLGRADARSTAEAVIADGREDVLWLRGGLAAWESAGFPTTEPAGVSRSHVPAITYQSLVATEGREIVVMDVRRPEPAPEPEPGTLSVASSPQSQLTDLGPVLPQARVVRPGAEPVQPGLFQPMGRGAGAPVIDPANELVVVIDNGDGSGEDLVRALRAAGNRRVVLLTGGEAILRREGRPGLEREGRGAFVIDASQLNGKGADE